MNYSELQYKILHSIKFFYLFPIQQKSVIIQQQKKGRKSSMKPHPNRYYSKQTLVKPKGYALPSLVKCQVFQNPSHNLQRHNFDSFKLKTVNAEQANYEMNQENLLAHHKSPNLLKNIKKSSFHNNDKMLANIHSEISKELYLKPLNWKFKKRNTLNLNHSLESQQRTQQKSQQYITEQNYKGEISELAGLQRKITRKYSLTAVKNQFQVKSIETYGKKSNFCDKQSKKQKGRILCYHEFLREQTELHDIELKTIETYQGQNIYYSIGNGNNREIIKEAMTKRWWWSETTEKEGVFVNFLWQQLKNPLYGGQFCQTEKKEKDNFSSFKENDQQFEEVIATSQTLHNHFQFNKYLGSQLSLYLTLKTYCKNIGKDLNNILLPTFFVEKIMDEQWKSFTKSYFQSLQINKINNWDVNINKKYWIIKKYNEKSIKNKIFATFKEIKLYIEKQSKNGSKFLIQKYISKPFLFKKRKFDIRCYALIVRLKEKIRFYLYKEGVINTACELFDIADLDNQYSNFTTESIQINNNKFGEYEPGNKMDFQQFQSYLTLVYGEKYNFMGMAFPLMNESLTHFAKANYQLLDQSKWGPSFELIQCEFTMDQNFKPWLIDFHTNPCLQTYCTTLEKIIPAVIEDAFKHTLDVLFPPPLEWPQSKRHLLSQKVKQTGFSLIFDEDSMAENNKKPRISLQFQIQSDKIVYQDELIDDTEYISSSNRLNDLQFLLGKEMMYE